MQSPQRIMFLIDTFATAYAGTEGQLLHLIEQLQSVDVEVEVTMLRPSSYVEKHGLPCPYGVLHIDKMLSLSSFRKLYAWGQILRRRGFPLVHIYFNDAAVIGPPVLRLHGIKTLVSRRDMGFWYTGKLLWLLRLNSLFVSRMVANCQAVERHVRREEWFAEKKTAVIYNGYEARPLKSPAQSEAVKTALGLPLDKKVVGMVANLRPIKRIPDLIEAAATLGREDTVFLIIGGGDPQPLVSRCRELGVDNQFFFVGSRQDVPELLPLFDIAVLCSDSEGFSNAIVEYMQAACPVVCSDVGGNAEIVEQKKTGYLYPKGDTGALAENLARLLDDAALRASLGDAGRRKVVDQLNMETMLTEHLKVYRQLIN